MRFYVDVWNQGSYRNRKPCRIHVNEHGRPYDSNEFNFIKVVQRVPVKILVKPSQDSQLVLRPGMNVEATIYTR